MTTKLDYLFRIESPWITLGLGEEERVKWIPTHFYAQSRTNVCVKKLRGRKMRTLQAMMNEFGAVLQFFDGFGENWWALQECLEYMDEWIPAEAYILVVEQAEEILADESPEQLAALLKTFHEVGEWWSKPILDNDRFNRKEIPFHVLLNMSKRDQAYTKNFIQIANEVNVPIRTEAISF